MHSCWLPASSSDRLEPAWPGCRCRAGWASCRPPLCTASQVARVQPLRHLRPQPTLPSLLWCRGAATSRWAGALGHCHWPNRTTRQTAPRAGMRSKRLADAQEAVDAAAAGQAAPAGAAGAGKRKRGSDPQQAGPRQARGQGAAVQEPTSPSDSDEATSDDSSGSGPEGEGDALRTSLAQEEPTVTDFLTASQASALPRAHLALHRRSRWSAQACSQYGLLPVRPDQGPAEAPPEHGRRQPAGHLQAVWADGQRPQVPARRRQAAGQGAAGSASRHLRTPRRQARPLRALCCHLPACTHRLQPAGSRAGCRRAGSARRPWSPPLQPSPHTPHTPLRWRRRRPRGPCPPCCGSPYSHT